MTLSDRKFHLRLRRALREAILYLARNPARSTSVSAGGGSRTVTFNDLPALRKELREVENELAADANARSGVGGFEVNYARWC